MAFGSLPLECLIVLAQCNLAADVAQARELEMFHPSIPVIEDSFHVLDHVISGLAFKCFDASLHVQCAAMVLIDDLIMPGHTLCEDCIAAPLLQVC